MTGACTRQTGVFPRSFTQGGGGQVKGDKASMGGLMRVDIDLMGGPNFERLYHKLKVLLLLNCNYMMQFTGLRLYENSLIYILWLSNSHSNAASIQKNRSNKLHHVAVALLIHSIVVALIFQ